MTSTSQKKEAEAKEPEAKVAADQTPDPKATSPQKEEKRQVPLDALTEQREKRREAEQKLEQLEKELAALKTKTDPHQPNPSDDSDVRHALKDLQERTKQREQAEQKRDLMVELGLSSTQQADAIVEIRSKNPDLSPAEALDMAARRKPDLFADRGKPGFDPAIHGSSRPQSTGSPPQPKKSERERRMQAMKNSTGSDQMALFYDYVGNQATQAMGWGEKKIRVPIPGE